jgi:hypothetical protein
VVFNSASKPARFVGFAQVTAQDGVDEARLGAVTAAFGLLDGFVDGGVIRDAIQPENLVEPEPQQVLQAGLLFAPGRLAVNQPVERGLPAHDAKNEFLREAAIGGGKPCGREGTFEQSLGIFVAVGAAPRTRAAISLGFWPFTSFNGGKLCRVTRGISINL